MRATRSVAGVVVVVTDGGSGAAIAEALARRGAAVVLGAEDGAVARATAEAIRERTGAVVLGARVDVAQAEWFGAFLEFAEAECGPVDVLVNNAGIGWSGPFADEPDDLAQRQLAVNVLGVINGMKLVIPGMRARGRGQVVNVTARARGAATPVATRHAVRGYSAAVHSELRGSGVTVSVVDFDAEQARLAEVVLRTVVRTSGRARPRA